jgi:hypothetical protein
VFIISVSKKVAFAAFFDSFLHTSSTVILAFPDTPHSNLNSTTIFYLFIQPFEKIIKQAYGIFYRS